MPSAQEKFNLFVDARRNEYEKQFLWANPEPELPPDVLPTLDLQAGGPGNAALRATLEGPDHRARNPRWYHDVALFVHPDRVIAKLLRWARGVSPRPAATAAGRDHGCPLPRDVIKRWGKLSNGMMQEVNRLRDRGHGGGDGGGNGGVEQGRDDPETVATLRKVLEMAADGHDAEVREDFERRHRHWHSVRTQFVGTRVDNAVARLDRRSSRPNVSGAQRRLETMDDFVRRVEVDVDREEEKGSGMRFEVDP